MAQVGQDNPISVFYSDFHCSRPTLLSIQRSHPVLQEHSVTEVCRSVSSYDVFLASSYQFILQLFVRNVSRIQFFMTACQHNAPAHIKQYEDI